jgi:hypothetical protein
MSNGVDILGGTSLSDYFLGSSPAPTELLPDVNAVDALATNWLSPLNTEAVNTAELAATAKVSPTQPTFLDNIIQPFSDVGAGVLQGAKEVGAGVVKALPSTLLNSLAQKLGLVATPVKAENGKTTYYLTPSQAGVAAASIPKSTTAGTGTATQVAGIATSTVLVGIAIAILIYLVVKSR